MKSDGVLFLSGQDLLELLSMQACIAAVGEAFRLHGEGKAAAPGALGVHAAGGGFHVKAAILELKRAYFAAKVNANFPQNPARWGLPTIQGMIVLCDAANGQPLALMDSMEITALRTAAATAVAAEHLARSDTRVATIVGCGKQGRAQLRALAQVRHLERVFAFDLDAGCARTFAREMQEQLGVEVTEAPHLKPATRQSDICVTCTPAGKFFLSPGDVSRGTFIAAIGADNECKQEIDPALLASSKVVVDALGQCAAMGDLHHALAAGLMKKSDVHAELGEVVAGRKAGRVSHAEVIIFDSTGMALQDVAAAAAAYERAIEAGRGLRLALAA
jgi:ornithine cyclodeaminase/alanine dehydrogenase-like protein (mu-crystallin family)